MPGHLIQLNWTGCDDETTPCLHGARDNACVGLDVMLQLWLAVHVHVAMYSEEQRGTRSATGVRGEAAVRT
jgi:hypothetical protein